MRHIVYKGRKYKRVVMNISSDAPFNEILKQVNGVAIPESPHDDEHVRYAILELINNSLRAHRERGVRERIRTEIHAGDETLNIAIVDRGGGFDTSRLPYEIDGPIDDVDTNSGRFQTYREDHQYRKFGMGLLVARRIFPVFSIRFYNGENQYVPFVPGKVEGTRIDMGIRWNNG